MYGWKTDHIPSHFSVGRNGSFPVRPQDGRKRRLAGGEVLNSSITIATVMPDMPTFVLLEGRRN